MATSFARISFLGIHLRFSVASDKALLWTQESTSSVMITADSKLMRVNSHGAHDASGRRENKKERKKERKKVAENATEYSMPLTSLQNTSLPHFRTPADLQKNAKWFRYLHAVYGESVNMVSSYPINLTDFWVFYSKKLQKAGHELDTFKNFQNRYGCPKIQGDMFAEMSGVPGHGGHDPPGTLWSYHPPPYTGLANGTKVEVTHCTHSREKVGYWMYYAPGSGVFYDLGSTKVYNTHSDALAEFLPGERCEGWRQSCGSVFRELILAAAAQNLTSLQFLNNSDQRCGLTAIEIVDLRGSGQNTCLSQVSGGLKGQCSCQCNPAILDPEGTPLNCAALNCTVGLSTIALLKTNIGFSVHPVQLGLHWVLHSLLPFTLEDAPAALAMGFFTAVILVGFSSAVVLWYRQVRLDVSSLRRLCPHMSIRTNGADIAAENTNFLWKCGIFAVFVLLGSLSKLTMHDARTIHYNYMCPIILISLLKIISSMVLFACQDKGHVLSVPKILLAEYKIIGSYCLVAGMYCAYDVLSYINLRHFDPGTFTIMLQLRTVVTAFIWQLVFKKQLGYGQYLGLLMITIGCMIKKQTGSFTLVSKTASIVPVLFQVVVNCGASVANEKLIKGQSEMTLNLQNAVLYSWTVVLCLLVGFLAPAGNKFSLNPLDMQQWMKMLDVRIMPSVLVLTILGITTSWLLKYLDSMWKAIATSMEVLLCSYAASFVFGYPVTIMDFLVIFMVILGVGIYSEVIKYQPSTAG